LTPLTVTIDSNTVVYSGSASAPNITYSLLPDNSLLLGSLLYINSSSGTITSSAVNAGTYTVSAAGLYSSQQGYDITTSTGTLTINKASLTITPNSNQTVVYNGTVPNPTLTYSSTGLVNGDSFTGALALTSPSKSVGSYAINQGTLGVSDSGNYNINFTSGVNYTVTPTPTSTSTSTNTPSYIAAVDSAVTIKGIQLPTKAATITWGTVIDFTATTNTGAKTANLTVAESGNSLTITSPSLDQSQVIAQPVNVFTVGANGFGVSSVYSVNASLGALTLTTTSVSSTSPVAPSNDLTTGNAQGLQGTFSVALANGEKARMILTYADNILNIRPVTQIAWSQMNAAEQRLLISAALIAAQNELGIGLDQVKNIYLE
jgi:hypothetical protein